MADDTPTVEALQAELRQMRGLREAERAENARLRAELDASLPRQEATVDVLHVIATSPADLDRVLQEIVEVAARLCEAPSAVLLQLRERDGRLAPRALFGRAREAAENANIDFQTARGVAPTRESGAGHAFVDGRTIQVVDMAEAVQSQYPDSRA